MMMQWNGEYNNKTEKVKYLGNKLKFSFCLKNKI